MDEVMKRDIEARKFGGNCKWW